MSQEFVKDRNEAFASGNMKEIEAYCKKYNIEMPKDENILWAGIHKVRANLFLSIDSPITLEQYLESCDWLDQHGFSPSITHG